MDKCLRCGKCCIFLDNEMFRNCIHFIRDKQNYCDIYENRLGFELITGIFCNKREDVETDYPGCPYNSRKPIHDAYRTGCWKERIV